MTEGNGTRLVTIPFFALAAATLAFFVSAGIVLPVAPRFAKEALGADGTGVGIAIGSFSVAALLLRPVVGWASDRFGRRPSLIGGAVVSVLALALHLVADNLMVFIVARALLGAGEGFLFVAALAAASDLAPAARRGEAISFLSLSLYLGVAIGPLIGETLLARGSWPLVWIGATAVAALAAVLAWLVPETVPVADPALRPRTRLIHPAGLFPGVVTLLGLWGMAGFLAFLPIYARETGLGGAGIPLTLYALVVVGLRIVGARLPDRFGAARLSSMALVMSAVGLALIGLNATPAGLIFGTIVFACGTAFTMPALLALAVSRVPPGERGSVVGTTTVFLDLAFGLAPVGLGVIADRAGFGPTFLVSAVMAAAGSALLLTWGRSQPTPVAAASG
jgi:MFS family permease